MDSYTFPEMLSANGWTVGTSPAFPEKAGSGATAYYSYHNQKGNRLTLAVFQPEKLIRFRIYDPTQPDPAWLQIGIDTDVDQVIAEIHARRDEIVRKDAFGFYFAISGLGDVSILAWEQYEEGYV
jgi:hypothetical protein